MIAILSNALSDVRMWITEAFQFDRYFDMIIFSFEESYHKPQPEIFHITLGRLRVQPEEALFIDDVACYIGSAQALGMHAVQFSTAPQVIGEIMQFLELR